MLITLVPILFFSPLFVCISKLLQQKTKKESFFPDSDSFNSRPKKEDDAQADKHKNDSTYPTYLVQAPLLMYVGLKKYSTKRNSTCSLPYLFLFIRQIYTSLLLLFYFIRLFFLAGKMRYHSGSAIIGEIDYHRCFSVSLCTLRHDKTKRWQNGFYFFLWGWVDDPLNS